MTRNKSSKPNVGLAELLTAHGTLQKLREEARHDDRRSDAQHFADTQFLICEAMKVERRRKERKA